MQQVLCGFGLPWISTAWRPHLDVRACGITTFPGVAITMLPAVSFHCGEDGKSCCSVSCEVLKPERGDV